MKSHPYIAARVTPETKNRLRAIAQAHQVTESAVLKRLLETLLLQPAGVSPRDLSEPVPPVVRGTRLYVRLRSDDYVLLRERASGRGMAAATYASFLLRAHLRAVTPMPDRELSELKRAVAGLGVIGRNLNQIVRAANQGRTVGIGAGDLRQILRACEALREHVKGLVNANAESWETGHEETHR